MSGTLGLLVGLIALAFLGSALARQTESGRVHLAVGAQYVALGLALGPSLLGVIEREWVDDFKPVMLAGTAWLSFCAGLRTAAAVHDGGSAASDQTLAARFGLPIVGWLLALLVAAAVAGACWMALAWTQLKFAERAILSGGAAALVGTFTPRGAHSLLCGDSEPAALRRQLGLNRLAPLVPSSIVAWLLASAPGHGLVDMHDGTRVVVTLLVGAILGMLVALLLSGGQHKEQRWALLLGASMLATGVTVRLSLSSVAALFVMGLVLALLSEQRDTLWDLVWPTQRAVLFPVALLTGAWVSVPQSVWAAALVGAAIVAGMLFGAIRAALTSLITRPTGQRISLARDGVLLPGAFGMCVGVEFAARLEPSLGAVLLALSAAALLMGHGTDLLMALPHRGRSDPPEAASADATTSTGELGEASKLGVE